MDYDNDGIQDMISGCYDPGTIFLFRGLGDGKYDSRVELKDEDGTPLVHHPRQLKRVLDHEKSDSEEKLKGEIQLRMASFASWPTMVDFDDDGDLDMLIGTFNGDLALRTNVGTREEPVFSKRSIRVKTKKTGVAVSAHANPVAADWDDDGLWDLIISAGDGSVSLFRNIGKKAKPEFAEREILIEKGMARRQRLEFDETPKVGIRSQICVTDYNGDGKLDIVLGDYGKVSQLKKLDEQQLAELDKLLAREKVLRKSVKNVDVGMIAYREPLDDEDDEAEYQKLQEEYLDLLDKKYDFYHHLGYTSFIWLFERK